MIPRCIKVGCCSLVVNKRYQLCNVHNWERMNPNKSFFQATMDKAKIAQGKMQQRQLLKQKKESVSKLKNRVKIKPRSSKRAKEEYQYYTFDRPEYLLEHPVCEFEGCLCEANQIHHRKGRDGKLLNNKKFFMAICPDHHHWVENHPEESKEKGYSINRLT